MLNIFLFGELWFWIAVAIFTIGTTVCIETCSSVFATILTIVIAVLLWNNIPALTWQQWLSYVAAYIAIGAIWSVARWLWHVKVKVKEFKKRMFSSATLQREIDPTENKSRIYLWIMYWPLSLVWSTCDGLIVNIFHSVRKALAGVYQSISDSAIKGLDLK